MRGKDTIFAKKLIETAFEKNSYLKNPLIYKEGDECNIFKQQSNFIFSIKDLGKLVKWYKNSTKRMWFDMFDDRYYNKIRDLFDNL